MSMKAASATRVALRFATEKQALSSLKALSKSFAPFKSFLSEDPRAWGKFLRGMQAHLEKAVSDVTDSPDMSDTYIEVLTTAEAEGQGRMVDKGDRWSPPDYETIYVKHPEKVLLNGYSHLDIAQVVMGFIRANRRLVADLRGFTKAFKRRSTERELKPLFKYVEFLVLRHFDPESVRWASEDDLETAVHEGQESEYDAAIEGGFSFTEAKTENIDFDREASLGEAVLTWNYSVSTEVEGVDVEFTGVSYEDFLEDREREPPNPEDWADYR